MKLIICESPGKIGTIQKYVGKNYCVLASCGHICDLPKKGIGVDIKNNFKTTFIISEGKEEIVKNIVDTAQKCDEVFLFTDSDREGEGISFHLMTELQKNIKTPIRRITTSEITKHGIEIALKNPRIIDQNMVDAYMARRILDRLVGYRTSYLVTMASGGKSAGRVQSAMLRVIADREVEIINFVPEEYWVLTAHLKNTKGLPYDGFLVDTIKVPNEQVATEIYDKVCKGSPLISSVEVKEATVNSLAPFVTMSMIASASSVFGWTAKRTMDTAQSLYNQGLITYMRTDSPVMSEEAVNSVRQYVSGHYPSSYLPPSPRVYGAKKGAQEAHECCRVTDVNNLRPHAAADELKLYEMIWKRTISCQMPVGKDEKTKVITKISDYDFVSHGSRVIFDGFRRVWDYSLSDDVILPELNKGDKCVLVSLSKDQKFTSPPPRYSDASLSKKCETEQITRPATFASFLGVLEDRGYIKREKKSFRATDLGLRVIEFLKAADMCFIDVGFTASMENLLDQIQDGTKNETDVLSEFWERLKKDIEKGKSIKSQNEVSSFKCPKCGSSLLKKNSRFGPFFCCEKSKKGDESSCQYIAKVGQNGEPVEKEIKKLEYADFVCNKCGSQMVKRKSKFGDFYGCKKYPTCKSIADMSGKFNEPGKSKFKKFKKKNSDD